MQPMASVGKHANDGKRGNQPMASARKLYNVGWFTLATESEAKSESEAQGALRFSINQKEEWEAESEAQEIGVRRIRRVSFSSDSASDSVVPIHTISELSSDSDSASVASVNQSCLVPYDVYHFF